MASILILFASNQGHGAKVARKVSEWLQCDGYRTRLLNAVDRSCPSSLGDIEACIVIGSLHQGKHQQSLSSFVRDHLAQLSQVPSAFLSISLSAAGKDDASRMDAIRCIHEFMKETEWSPTVSTPVAGVLAYTKYNWLMKWIMKRIAKKQGGDTDTARDHEYTDWRGLERFIRDFARVAIPRKVPA